MIEQHDELNLGNEEVFAKLGKSIVAATNLDAGSELTLDNLGGKILPNTGSQYVNAIAFWVKK